MKLKFVKVENYRALEKLELQLDPSLTVLHGDNGYGKTSVLSAIAVGLRDLFRSFPCEPGVDFCEEDRREGKGDPRVLLAPVEGTVSEWKGNRKDADREEKERLALQGAVEEALVLCRRDSFAKSLDFREDGIGRSRPHERVCVGVPFGRVAFDALDELRHLAERIAPNRLAGKDIEPDLHLIEPRSIGGGVVNVKSGTPCQPSLDLGMLMRGVVVDDEMNIEVSGDVGLDGAQELKELLVTMTGLALGHHFPGGYVQGGKSGWWCHGACNRA